MPRGQVGISGNRNEGRRSRTEIESWNEMTLSEVYEECFTLQGSRWKLTYSSRSAQDRVDCLVVICAVE